LEGSNKVVCYERGQDFSVLTGCEVIINANGNSSKVEAERNPLQNFDSNVNFVLKLSVYCTEVNALLVHFSSEEACIEEQSSPTQKEVSRTLIDLSNYGLSKYLGEILVQKHTKNWLIIRPSGLVGQGMKKGPIYDLLNEIPLWIAPESELRILQTATTAKITHDLICNYFTNGSQNEVFNLTSSDTITIEEIAKVFSKNLLNRQNQATIYPKIQPSKNLDSYTIPRARDEILEFLKESS
jgi:dTDP-4-dehydrorhamnose reductase